MSLAMYGELQVSSATAGSAASTARSAAAAMRDPNTSIWFVSFGLPSLRALALGAGCPGLPVRRIKTTGQGGPKSRRNAKETPKSLMIGTTLALRNDPAGREVAPHLFLQGLRPRPGARLPVARRRGGAAPAQGLR